MGNVRELLATGQLAEAERLLDCAATQPPGVIDPYELARQRGVLHYRREQMPEALARFECALAIARERGDAAGEARELKNVGTTLRRLGDLRGALEALIRSLEAQRRTNTPAGAALNNLGDLYRELGEWKEAERHYRDALSSFRATGAHVEAGHVLESMAELLLDQNQPREAERLLQEAMSTYRATGNRLYELRAYASLIRTSLLVDDLDAARDAADRAEQIASVESLSMDSGLLLQISRVEGRSGRWRSALERLDRALQLSPPGSSVRADILDDIASAKEQTDAPDAMDSLRRAHGERLLQASAQHDRDLSWMRTRFETAERDRRIEALETEGRLRKAELTQRTLGFGVAIATALAGLLLGLMWLQRSRHRDRLRREAQRALHEAEVERYKRETRELAQDRALLQRLLDTQEGAVGLVDAEGNLLVANLAARRRLGIQEGAIEGISLSTLAGDETGSRVALALESLEDTRAVSIDLDDRNGEPLSLRLSAWPGGDGLVVVMIDAANREVEPPSLSAAPSEDLRAHFRTLLVELMLSSVESWERATQTNRLELAEKSRLWRVNIDDGRLRARAMERYMSLSRLPQNPRWRDVLRTAYFVLGHCESLTGDERSALQGRVDAVLALTRREALA